jgi:hypothetical protein
MEALLINIFYGLINNKIKEKIYGKNGKIQK